MPAQKALLSPPQLPLEFLSVLSSDSSSGTSILQAPEESAALATICLALSLPPTPRKLLSNLGQSVCLFQGLSLACGEVTWSPYHLEAIPETVPLIRTPWGLEEGHTKGTMATVLLSSSSPQVPRSLVLGILIDTSLWAAPGDADSTTCAYSFIHSPSRQIASPNQHCPK